MRHDFVGLSIHEPAMNKTKGRRDKTGIRTLLFLIALGTIPFYILGIGLWLFSPNRGAQDRPPGDVTTAPGNPDEEPTWTPLNSGGNSGTVTPNVSPGFPTLTPFQPITPFFTPIGGGQATFIVGTPIFVVSPTPIPTRFITVTPSPTSAATNTPPPPPPTAIPPTSAPPPTQPPLVPPTDTPSA
jgi:hypothetical protein